jgi:RHS repeat-associated protein
MGGASSGGQGQYFYLPTASGPMPIAAEIDGLLYAIHSDHLNTPRQLTQQGGQPAWQWAYSAYGDEAPTLGANRFTNETTNPTTGSTGTPPVRFNLRYPGQYFDEETGLHYNYFRSYDPRVGRYTQSDPIGLEGGWNRMAYVEGNPLSKVDPRGLDNPGMGPFGPYWTAPDCDYYQNRCTGSGGAYYCSAAPQICKKWPDIIRPPGGRPDWVSCVRVCLQGKDNQCNQTPPNTCDTSGVNTSCNVRIHRECWTQCYGDGQ